MTTYRVPEDVSGTLNVSNGRIDYAYPAGLHSADDGPDADVLAALVAGRLAEIVDEPPKRGVKPADGAKFTSTIPEPDGDTIEATEPDVPGDTITDEPAAEPDATPEV